MAYEENLRPVSIPANADLSASQYCFVVINATGKVAVVGAGLAADGILQDKPAAADRPAAVGATPGQISKCRAGASFTAGDDLTPDSTGRAVTATSGDVKGAKALEDASGADVVVSVLLKLEVEPLA